MSIRDVGKAVAERVLRLTLGNPGRMRGRSLILAFHNVLPDRLAGMGDGSLHLPLSRFLRHLDLIQRACRVTSLADMLAGNRSEGRPQVAITFDDAYRGAVELALPELARRGLPCVLFVAPGLLGHRSFWWDELADTTGGLPSRARRHALEVQQGRHEHIRSATPGAPGTTPLPDCYGCAVEDQVRELSRLGTVTLAAHSWSHPNLTRIDPASLADELSRPLEWIRSAAGPTLPVLAYPYGLASPAVEAAAEKAGYAAGLLVDGGWLIKGTSPWRIPRFNVPAGLSEDGFMLRLSGVLGVPSTSRVG